MLYKDTPYKVIKYLAKLASEKVLPKKFEEENFIRYLIDRQFLCSEGTQFRITKKFEEKYSIEIENILKVHNTFIEKHELTYLENRYSIRGFEALAEIERDKGKIIEQEISFQNILTQYFGSSKYKSAQSNLHKAIKQVLGIEVFPEESKDLQYISILYPKSETRFIIICENKNRLTIPRHDYIEFWYAGGKNIKQFEFIPKPKYAIFYLFDWDFDGLEIYVQIKHKYFPTLQAFLPTNPESLMKKQLEVKNHNSKWKDKKLLTHLNKNEKALVEVLIKNNSIIEEQNILLTKENLIYNSIC